MSVKESAWSLDLHKLWIWFLVSHKIYSQNYFVNISIKLERFTSHSGLCCMRYTILAFRKIPHGQLWRKYVLCIENIVMLQQKLVAN